MDSCLPSRSALPERTTVKKVSSVYSGRAPGSVQGYQQSHRYRLSEAFHSDRCQLRHERSEPGKANQGLSWLSARRLASTINQSRRRCIKTSATIPDIETRAPTLESSGAGTLVVSAQWTSTLCIRYPMQTCGLLRRIHIKDERPSRIHGPDVMHIVIIETGICNIVVLANPFLMHGFRDGAYPPAGSASAILSGPVSCHSAS